MIGEFDLDSSTPMIISISLTLQSLAFDAHDTLLIIKRAGLC